MRRGVRWILGLAGVLALVVGAALLLGWGPARRLEVKRVHEDLPEGGSITMTEVRYDGGEAGAVLLVAAGVTAIVFAMRRPQPAP